jgi:hypothetical protein
MGPTAQSAEIDTFIITSLLLLSLVGVAHQTIRLEFDLELQFQSNRLSTQATAESLAKRVDAFQAAAAGLQAVPEAQEAQAHSNQNLDAEHRSTLTIPILHDQPLDPEQSEQHSKCTVMKLPRRTAEATSDGHALTAPHAPAMPQTTDDDMGSISCHACHGSAGTPAHTGTEGTCAS